VSSLKSHWAEILVARRVEQIEGEPLLLEAHHRRGDRDAALALDRHPIRARPPPVAPRLDLARQLDRAPEQQQFLGQCRLAGVGVRNIAKVRRRKISSVRVLINPLQLLPGYWPWLATGPAAPALAVNMMTAQRFANCYPSARNRSR
jgi:hypothetical protein